MFAGTSVEEMKDILGYALTVAKRAVSRRHEIRREGRTYGTEESVQSSRAYQAEYTGPPLVVAQETLEAESAGVGSAPPTTPALANAMAMAGHSLNDPPLGSAGGSGKTGAVDTGIRAVLAAAKMSAARSRSSFMASSRRVLGTPANRHEPPPGSERTVVPLYVYLLRVVLAHSTECRGKFDRAEEASLYKIATEQRWYAGVALVQASLPTVARYMSGVPAFGGSILSATVAVLSFCITFFYFMGFVGPFTVACLVRLPT